MPVTPGRPFGCGDIVFAKMKGFPPWPARIDMIRPSRCNVREQENLPTPHTDPDFHWPIFFYGSHQISWLPQKDLFEFEEHRDEFGANPQVKRAMEESRKNTFINFQFGEGNSGIAWSERHSQMAHAWFRHQSDEVANETAWDRLPPRKKGRKSISRVRVDSSPTKATQVLEDIPEDAVVVKYQDSIHRIEDINEGDFIAAMYEKPYYGLVTKKTKSHSGDSILVQFYTRSDKHDVFIEKKGDVDRITEERQGYIFLHALAHEVVMSKTKSGKQKCFVIQEYTPEDFDLAESKWGMKVSSLRGVPDEEENYEKKVRDLIKKTSSLFSNRGIYRIPIGCEKLRPLLGMPDVFDVTM
ncbi:Oidioi.mRNA.OKI2018_I69.PAR.g11209.t2.cds [Oikopleura dioica]|uniref:Oidioi.mRNA.OKI2018_I69.PAR.g11209.t2.cds n=1 Tax=Oikopleura dioica TaxID=34765 RepID=A0ABN7RUN0_OIKDI|nr:Oidioi.mRNA.OKI2018_I69.PAR.g11209.t2.cds [Oikopleura dioica]